MTRSYSWFQLGFGDKLSFTTLHIYFLTDSVSTEMICAGASIQLLGWPNTLRKLRVTSTTCGKLLCFLTDTSQNRKKDERQSHTHWIKLYALQIYFLFHLVCLSMLTWNCCKQHCKQAKCCLQFISDKHKHCIIPVESNFNFTFKYLLNQPPCNVLWWVINTFEKTNLLSIASI